MPRGRRRDAGAGAVPASAAGSHGPLTCLDGFVWRQATPRDHVCVTPEVRAQTARDNALAPTRRSATSGTFGPDLCVAGFVWREALPGDRVCVTPATWQQVHDDNLTAGARRNALRVQGRRPTDDTGRRATGCAPTASTSAWRASRCSAPAATKPRMSWPVRARRTRRGPAGALLPDRAAPLRAHAGLRHPRPGPVLAALVLAAPLATGCAGP